VYKIARCFSEYDAGIEKLAIRSWVKLSPNLLRSIQPWARWLCMCALSHGSKDLAVARGWWALQPGR